MPAVPATTKYNSLVKDISAIYERSRQKARRALNRILTQAYWEIGRRIVTVEQDNQIRAKYGAMLIPNLSKDLTKKYGNGFSETNLKHMREFYVENPIRHPGDELGWTKHRILLSINDRKVRKQYQQKAIKGNWTKDKLIAELKKVKALAAPAEQIKPRAGLKLNFTRGTLGVHRVVIRRLLNGDTLGPHLDLGFSVYHEGVKGLAGRRHGDIVEVSGRNRVRKSKHGKQDLYTFKAIPKKVTDGDTLWVEAEQGFEIYISQKLRLRGINAPELNTKRGQTAKKFLQNTLDSVDFIVIKTHGGDKYDRYLTDIFYLPGESDPRIVAAKGIFLNQEMIDQQLADLYLGRG